MPEARLAGARGFNASALVVRFREAVSRPGFWREEEGYAVFAVEDSAVMRRHARGRDSLIQPCAWVFVRAGWDAGQLHLRC